MPSLERKPENTGVLIRSKTGQLFWYNKNESVFDKEPGDVWINLPYDQTNMFYVWSNTTLNWNYDNYQNLPPKVKTILSLIF